ncbi:MAG: CocE/NonD family hydrolase [Bryobacterales bacterium]|nr:CocE/NonD family hydrolase [Bryobacterales bacterium]
MRLACLSLIVVAAAPAAVRPPTEQIVVESNVVVPMRDGIKLYADVYRPARQGKFPVLITRTPYGKQRDGIHGNLVNFARRGYAVVAQDVRGRFESEGKWDPFRYEAEDGYDTVEWAAKQSWSNGKVGMFGGSYLGNVQWQAAAQTPPSLVAVFPVVASTSLYHNTWYHGGAFKLGLAFGWGVVRNPRQTMYPQWWHTDANAPEEWRYENLFWKLPLKTFDLLSSNQPVQHFRDWIEHQSYDAYWKQISVEEKFASVKVPAHVHGGWFDLLVGGTINGFTGMRKHGGTPEARRHTKMTVGPWGHGPSRKFGDVDFGPDANRVLFERNLQWFDHFLMGMATGIDREPPVEIFYMGVNKWVHHDDWPVPGTKFTPFYLASGGKANSARGDGTVSMNKPGGAPSDGFLYDPDNPVPTVGGNDCCGAPIPAGPVDQRPVERRHDVLVYTAEVQREPLAIAGPVRMKLHAATDGPDTDYFIKLVDVHPDGFAMNIAEGILRARFRNGLDRMELLKPGEIYEYEIDMRATAHVFLPGHRIRVDVTSSNFPQFDRNLNTGEDLGVAVKPRIAKQTVYHSAQRPSHIVLPVVAVPK